MPLWDTVEKREYLDAQAEGEREGKDDKDDWQANKETAAATWTGTGLFHVSPGLRVTC